MDFNTSSKEHFPFLSTLLSENHPINFNFGNMLSSKALSQNQPNQYELDQNSHNVLTDNHSLNSHNFDLTSGEGSSRNLFLGVEKTGFRLSDACVNELSPDSRGYSYTPSMPNLSTMLHGSEKIGFRDFHTRSEAQAISESSIHRSMSLQDRHKSTKVMIGNEASSISGEDTYQKVDEKSLTSINERICYKHPKKTNMIKGQWTKEEDEILIELVKTQGMKKWSIIAKSLPGRVGKQCRERWYNHLKPDIKKSAWSEQEELILIQAHKDLGNRWAEISRRLAGRSENTVKNHWNATKRRYYVSHCKTKDSTSRSNLLQDYIRSLNSTTPPNKLKNEVLDNKAPDDQAPDDQVVGDQAQEPPATTQSS